MQEDIRHILKTYWGYNSFRPLQEDIINAVLQGNDTLALLPTGGGKSICFQVPALAKPGICIVVSPLIALMKDQVENLQGRDIKAVAIYSGMSYREINIALDNCIYGDFKFLYLSPERLKSELVRIRLQQMQINLLAIDEAHCISQWGYDFRPEYLQIAELRELFPKVPVLALTASATPDVVKDIQEKLGFKKENVFKKSFTRANLAYVVNQTEDKQHKLLHMLNRVPGTALIYVRSRRKTQEIATYLSLSGIRADYYHAGLTHELRNKKQDDWINNRTRVMVCTNAFGMGIDKPDVRLVIHDELPDTLEAYYQEAGRAGRDEKKAYAVLLTALADIKDARDRFEQSFPPEKEIKRVYQALCNFYGVPAGASPERSFDFDIADFCTRFDMKPLLVYPALKILEQCDILALNEVFFEPAKLMVTVSHEVLYKFQVEHEAYDDFIKILLRSYGGLFDRYVPIHEKTLASKTRIALNTIVDLLNRLTRLQIIDYQPQKDKPQITFLQERLHTEHVQLSPLIMVKRKQLIKQKLEAMIVYAQNTTLCRSRKLVGYFNEYDADDCGTCDICLLRKKTELSAAQFEELVNTIEQKVSTQPLHIDELVTLIKGYHATQSLEAIRFLLDNNKLRYNVTKQLEWSQPKHA
ncbi:MAG: ATP-dependent DNA helicase RecQ [Bacteroidota bacterium]|jgi:ATP-dependent DNA helicase RecQ